MVKYLKRETKEVEKPGVDLPNLGIKRDKSTVVESQFVETDPSDNYEDGPFTQPKDK